MTAPMRPVRDPITYPGEELPEAGDWSGEFTGEWCRFGRHRITAGVTARIAAGDGRIECRPCVDMEEQADRWRAAALTVARVRDMTTQEAA